MPSLKSIRQYPFSLAPLQQRRFDALVAYAGTPSCFRTEAKAALKEWRKPCLDADGWLALAHRAQRLHRAHVAGLANNTEFFAAVKNLPDWRAWTAPAARAALHRSLSDKLFNADPARGDVPVIILGDGARITGRLLLDTAVLRGIRPVIIFTDELFDEAVLKYAGKAGIRALARDYLALMKPVTTRIVARARDGVLIPAPRRAAPENRALYREGVKPFTDRVSGGRMHYTLTSLPSADAARREGMTMPAFTRLFFEMCDQPWDRIGRAQDHLIGILNRADKLRFTNNDGTDLRMSVAGFTFCNSLIARNVPGSEVFSAPVRNSVDGIVVAKGRFIPPSGGGLIRNLTMQFDGGRLTGWSADEGQDVFERAISVDEGARHVGEIGIGTNPHLKRHMADGLLVEKIGGSFHIALGDAYRMTDYMGTPVMVDNGNRSALHWDVTTMLYGSGGRIVADGRVVMEDGVFVDPALDILNRGWEAVPPSQRPAYWRDFDFAAHRARQAE